jgi:ATP-dependent DNA helicase RecG
MHLRKLGLETAEDVLWHFPRRMEDRSNLPPIMMCRPGYPATVRGRLTGVNTRPLRGGKVLLRATVDDGTGVIDLIWFNQPWVARDLNKVTGEIIAYGMVKEGRRGLEMSSAEWEAIDEDDEAEDFARIVPVYPLKEGVPQWAVRKAAHSAVEYFASQVKDPLPDSIRKKWKLPQLSWCLRQMHLPDSEDDRARARERLVFEEFLYLQLALQMLRSETKHEIGIAFPLDDLPDAGSTPSSLFGDDAEQAGSLEDQVHKMLPFDLTGAQKRVIDEIWSDMKMPAPMNRLVQGDVGSGKTAVAACAILGAVRCGYQAALMAPTEILAEQHAMGLRQLFEPLGIEVSLLVGKQTAAQKRKALQAAASGEARLCIGTHALIQEGVEFQNLGLVVIDEQHRFGVMQRAALRAKSDQHPDVLVMTATPIPRTLTMTFYGDLDLSVIDEMPPGRKPIKTHWKRPNQRDQVYDTVRSLIKEGRQAYFVCPMISESEKMQAQAAEDLYYRLKEGVYKDLRLGLLHGQMKGVEKDEVMTQFRNHELDILVSTVVIEVGVDVSNASVMVVEDAFRFGLSQLHQLRGRVGRGDDQSFCILISEAKTPDADQRLSIMARTSDGFEIAEEDLKLRGAGDIAGTRQSGRGDFRLADLIKDGVLLERARQAAMEIIEADPKLEKAGSDELVAAVKSRRSDMALATVS